MSNALRSSENNLQAWPLVTFLRSVLLVWGDKSLIGVDSRKNGRNKGRDRKRRRPFSSSVAVKGVKGRRCRKTESVCVRPDKSDSLQWEILMAPERGQNIEG